MNINFNLHYLQIKFIDVILIIYNRCTTAPLQTWRMGKIISKFEIFFESDCRVWYDIGLVVVSGTYHVQSLRFSCGSQAMARSVYLHANGMWLRGGRCQGGECR